MTMQETVAIKRRSLTGNILIGSVIGIVVIMGFTSLRIWLPIAVVLGLFLILVIAVLTGKFPRLKIQRTHKKFYNPFAPMEQQYAHQHRNSSTGSTAGDTQRFFTPSAASNPSYMATSTSHRHASRTNDILTSPSMSTVPGNIYHSHRATHRHAGGSHHTINNSPSMSYIPTNIYNPQSHTTKSHR